MYNVPVPVATVRTRIREEFEKHRFANKLSIVDVLIFKSNADYQVRFRWAPNSIAVWDNRSTSHFGPIDGPHLKEQRIVHRTTVGGDLPVGPGGFVSRPLVGELFNTIS